MFQDISVMGC